MDKIIITKKYFMPDSTEWRLVEIRYYDRKTDSYELLWKYKTNEKSLLIAMDGVGEEK